jgi:hypothetical protein
MKTIDKDHSGTIEWEEFLDAMTNWYHTRPPERSCCLLTWPCRFKQDYKVHKGGNTDPMTQKKTNPDRVRACPPPRRCTVLCLAQLGRMHGGQERKDVHKRIKSFFAQFKKGSTFDKIRSELQKEKRVSDLDSDAVDMRMSTSGTSSAAFSSNQKVLATRTNGQLRCTRRSCP